MRNVVVISAALLLSDAFVCQATADEYEPQWKPGADSEFEVGTQLRPWTIRSREGTASFAFELHSGTYDIRITYFDGPVGQSEVSISIAGDEKASFKMDEDCNCWRWRRFESIAINAGDRVALAGKADQDDLARLDFIEFIEE